MADNFGEIAERSSLRKRQKAEGRQRGVDGAIARMANLGGVTVAGWGCRSCVPQRMGCDDVGPRLCDRTHLRVLLRTLQQARVLLRTLQQACHGRTSETKQPQGACAIRRAVLLRPANEAAAAPPQQTVCTLPSRRRTRRSAVQRHFQVGASSASPSTTSASADFGLVALASCSHTLGTVRT